ncbi:hypothetical protein BDQ17DRAFT_1420453 [Cyathus striatus]|nr:hypothetical protein BDQ17DRAFT_1420453 [Cyathus striatus]
MVHTSKTRTPKGVIQTSKKTPPKACSSGTVSTRRSAQLVKSHEDLNITLMTSDCPRLPDVIMSPPPPMPTANGDETSPMSTVLWSSSSGMSPDNDTLMKDLLSSTPFDNPTGLDAGEGDVGVLIFPDGGIGGSVIPSPSNILDIYSSNRETSEDPSRISEGLSATEPPIPPLEKISEAGFPAASSLEPYIFLCSSNLMPSAQYPSILGMLGGTKSLHLDNHPSSSHLLLKVSEAPVTLTEEPQLDLGIGSPNQHLNNYHADHPLPKNSNPAYSPLQRLVLNPKADIKLFLEENIHIPIQVKEKDVASIGAMGTIFVACNGSAHESDSEVEIIGDTLNKSDSGGEAIHDDIGMFIKKGAQKLGSGL